MKHNAFIRIVWYHRGVGVAFVWWHIATQLHRTFGWHTYFPSCVQEAQRVALLVARYVCHHSGSAAVVILWQENPQWSLTIGSGGLNTFSPHPLLAVNVQALFSVTSVLSACYLQLLTQPGSTTLL